MGDAVDFITKFHSLQGNLVGERKKNFSEFLRELESASDQQVEWFFKNLDPQNYLENLFKIDALIYFKRTVEMLDILKGDNEAYRAKIMKQQWFFENAFKDLDAETLVNDFIPQLPFKDRRKFVKKVLRTMNERQVDLVFTALYQRYGLSFAKHFLHFCSSEKIKDFLQIEEIDMRPNQVIHVFDTNVELFVHYLEYYRTTYNRVYEERKVTDHIGLTNLEFLINLHEGDKIEFGKLGRRTSKKGFEIIKNDILEKKYKTVLNKNVMYRKLGSQFKKYYFDRFPTFYSDLSLYREFSFLRNIPKSKRWPTFAEAFLERFPDHDIKNIDIKDLITYCPEKNIIKIRALQIYNQDKDETYLQYVESKLSIPLIKERINITSDIINRKKLIVLLLKTCAENKNLESLEEVLKYICYRHKNEKNDFRSEILKQIKKLFKLEELNENHWNYLNEMIKMERILKEFCVYSASPLIEAYLEFLFKNKKEFATALREYIDDMVNEDCFFLNVKNPELFREILVEILNIFNNISTSIRVDYDVIDCMITFNESHPQHNILYSSFHKFYQHVSSLIMKTSDFSYNDIKLINKLIFHKIKFPDSLPIIDNTVIQQVILNVALEQDGELLTDVLTTFILKKSRTPFENDLLVVYFEQLFNNYSIANIVNWFLINEPQTIVVYFPKILEEFSSRLLDHKLRLIKCYSHFMFDIQMIDYLRDKAASVPCHEKFDYIKSLKTLLTTDEFAQMVSSQYLPDKEKIDLTDEKMMEVYKLQCDIAKMLHKVEEPHKMLQIVFKFCLGDYLQSALPSLYGIFYKSPEIKLYSCMETLSKRAVSVNKHAVFLSCQLLTQEFAINTLTNTKHTNVSSQKHLFSSALKYFQKNPSETLLNIVIETMSTIDKNDKEALSSLVPSNIPKRFKVPYIEKCWTFYESIESQGANVQNHLASVLSTLLNDLNSLNNVSTAFITNILNNYLPSKRVYNVMEFAAKVLIYREHEQTEHFDLVFKIMSTQAPSETRSFLNLFTEEEVNLKFIKLLDTYWHKYLTVTGHFLGHLFLKLWLIDVTKESEEKFAENVVTFLEKVTSEYGLYSLSLFQDVLEWLLENETVEYEYRLFNNILKSKTTASTCILVLNIMNPITTQNEHTEIFQNIMDIIRNVKEPIVSIYYNKYVSDHNVCIPQK